MRSDYQFKRETVTVKSIASIQIVEDELIIAMDLKLHLQKQGYNVIKIDVSGEEAIKTASDQKPDIVLMDINLKGSINGLKAAEEILTYNIPVIFVTSQKDESTTEQIKKLSPHFIFKPYHHSTIYQMIESILKEHPCFYK